MLFELYYTFFTIGLLSFGGGYAILPMILHIIVERNGWLTLSAFADLLAISQVTPGPIAINASTFVGTQLAGIPGAIVATLGCISPSLIIVLTLAYLYKRYRSLNMVQGVLNGLRPAVVALIAASAVSIVAIALWGDEPSYRLEDIHLLSVIFMIIGFIILRRWKPNPVILMLTFGILFMGLSFFIPI